MQTDLIETFLDLCDTRSFNRTAERLGVTQSTVSGRIKALEVEIGRRLFQRSRSGTELTTEGLKFEPHARSLRHGWASALNAIRETGPNAASMRIGIQHDLLAGHFRDLIIGLRETLPGTAFFVEADYSTQMCTDLVSGALDFAILFSPRQHPDLHFETLGEISYVMVSTQFDRLSDVRSESYILANYSPAFAHSHSAIHPDLTRVSLSIGQNAAMVGLLATLSGTAYVLRQSAEDLVASGAFCIVADAPPIEQTLYAGVNMRQRHRTSHRRLMAHLHSHFNSTTPPRRRAGHMGAARGAG